MRQERYRTGSHRLFFWYTNGIWIREYRDKSGEVRLSPVRPGTTKHAMLERRRTRLIELKQAEESE